MQSRFTILLRIVRSRCYLVKTSERRLCLIGHMALWFLGYPEAALADTNHALKDAREIGQAGTLLHTLNYATIAHFLCGNYAAAEALAKELFILADEKAALAVWKPAGLLYQGWVFAVVGKASEAVQLIAPGLAACRSTGTTTLTPVGLSLLAKSYADLGQFDDAWRSIDEAKTVIDVTKETWFEPHVHRIAGEIALMSPRAGRRKSRSIFRACARSCASAASQILGTPRGNEHGTALA